MLSNHFRWLSLVKTVSVFMYFVIYGLLRQSIIIYARHPNVHFSTAHSASCSIVSDSVALSNGISMLCDSWKSEIIITYWSESNPAVSLSFFAVIEYPKFLSLPIIFPLCHGVCICGIRSNFASSSSTLSGWSLSYDKNSSYVSLFAASSHITFCAYCWDLALSSSEIHGKIWNYYGGGLVLLCCFVRLPCHQLRETSPILN